MTDAAQPDAAADGLRRAEQLLARLEAARERLAATEDPEQAVEVVQELAEIAKQVDAAIRQAQQEAHEGPTPEARAGEGAGEDA